MTPEFVRKHAAPVPRYTSYPTALSFSEDVGCETYTGWLSELSDDDTASVYVHIPFCQSICWYCACHTKGSRNPVPVKRYLKTLRAEIDMVSSRLSTGPKIAHLHWGGGSPNVLDPGDIAELASTLNTRFNIMPDAEFSVEIDPRFLTAEQAKAFAKAGVTRVSLGVQDFDDDVQAAIGRIQPFNTTQRAANLMRENSVRGLNIDLVYGLPRQTRTSVERTMDGVLALAPDRIALFGYAHLPQKFARQKLIDADALPSPEQRFALANRMASRLTEAGYVRVGLDHFAQPGDSLALGPIRRNFQGYTTDVSGALIGLGATAIGQMPQGYVQNAVAIADYESRIASGQLATAKGYAMTREDLMRALVIDRVMCDLTFPAQSLRDQFGSDAEPLIADALDLAETDRDGLVRANGDGFSVTEKGRPFLRSIASCFDSHTDLANRSFSTGV